MMFQHWPETSDFPIVWLPMKAVEVISQNQFFNMLKKLKIRTRIGYKKQNWKVFLFFKLRPVGSISA